MQTRPSPAAASVSPDPWLDQCLKHVIGAGLAMVLMFPFARGQIPLLGWAPLWLVGMPLVAWWALHRFRLPSRAVTKNTSRRRRGSQAQARRRTARMPAAGRRAA